MTAASGAIAIAKDLLRTSLANCTALRAWQGASYSVAQLLARIYFDALPAPAAGADEFGLAERVALRPFVLIYKPTEQGVTYRRNARPQSNTPYGTLVAYFEQATPEAGDTTDPGEIDRRFENLIGETISSTDGAAVTLATLGSGPGYLDWTEIRESGPHRSDPREEPTKDDFQYYFLQIEWGVRS